MWTEEQARKAHKERRQYTVLVNDAERPYAVIEVSGDFVGVTFFDDLLRESLSYQFQETEPGKLFLSMATYREFPSDTNNASSGTSYIFKQNGDVSIRKQSISSKSIEESKSTADVSGNYEQYPEFGQYEGLLRTERG